LFEKYAVNPKRWYLVVEEVRKKHQLPKEITGRAREILRQIYLERLDFLDGAEEALVGLRELGVELKIVTHASKKWTRLKYKNWLKLDRFLRWEDVFAVNINEHKTDSSWLMACDYFEVKPNEVGVVGDSPRSNINPVRRIGVEKCFLVEDEIQWSVHNQPIDEGVIKVKNLIGVLDYFHS
jgi:phosphoglycolate phosphatase-like HAD superfamily hydrolase